MWSKDFAAGRKSRRLDSTPDRIGDNFPDKGAGDSQDPRNLDEDGRRKERTDGATEGTFCPNASGRLVENMERGIAFYVCAFGAEVVFASPTWTSLRIAGVRLALALSPECTASQGGCISR
jgi:hypothetical protein